MRHETWECPGCGKLIKTQLLEPGQPQEGNAGVCNECEANDLWIDPAGGLHQGYEGDPAAMYE